jgi:1-acyl-sn-glycerol-3-phosphate acyltransferase
MKPFYRTGWLLFRLIARVILRMKIIRPHLIPRTGPLIIASNHIAYADPPLLGSTFPMEIHFLAKRELFRNRLFRFMIASLNAHPINRRGFDRRAIETAIEILQNKQGILIFPEGTRSDGRVLLPARPGIGLVARRGSFPVLPVYIHGTHRLGACFLGREKCRVIIGEIIPAIEIAKYPDNREGYKKLADDIMESIRRLKEEYSAGSVGD